MNSNNIDQALAALADALKSQEPNVDPMKIVEKLPHRSLSGDHIIGGKIQEFSSGGINDGATQTQIALDNKRVTIKNLKVENVEDNLSVAGDLNVLGKIVVDTLEVRDLKADLNLSNNNPIKYTDNIDGKGFLWVGKDYTKQFVYTGDKIFSSENIDIAKDKNLSINGIPAITQDSLGVNITKSNLKEVGRLKGLLVDGGIVINNYMVYDSNTDRLGLGTDEPNGALSIAEDGIEIILGTEDFTRAKIGTFASNDLNIVTNNTSRISVGAEGNILLGNRDAAPIQVSMHGRLSIRVGTPDPNVDLHVRGAIKFNDRLQKYASSIPTTGAYNKGDIFWNIEPSAGAYVGWICTKAGEPGMWEPFGKIGQQ